jgi:hypothetical protein
MIRAALPHKHSEVPAWFHDLSAGVELVELMMDKDNPTVNRGFAFVSFYNYACADEARKRFMETSDNT